jgi:phosphatidylserine decarboxylase
MSFRIVMRRLGEREDLNFLLTNRIPRRLVTRLMGWVSRIEQPLVRDLSIRAWRLFTDVDLSDAATTEFRSLHDCFIRRLKPGARPVDPDPAVLASPCDGIVVACGAIGGTELLQAKGRTYTLEELLGDAGAAAEFRNGCWATIRLPSSVYHRFHAPCDGQVERVTYFPGDTWNTNPAALNRVDRLYCRNERAALRLRLSPRGPVVTLVPVAAILVASLRLNFLDLRLHLGYRGPRVINCGTNVRKGLELGWFEHGSTIIVLAPPGFDLAPGVASGGVTRVGRPLLRMRDAARTSPG